MEICDIFDETGTRIGKNAIRGTELLPNEYYLSVQVWIRNEFSEYLIQQRAFHLKSGPGVWATTAGYVLAGEESIFGAIREAQEELGIQLLPTQLSRFDRLKTQNRIEDIWVAEVLKNSIGTPILNSEVAAWQWVSKHAIQRMINSGEFFGYSYFDRLPE